MDDPTTKQVKAFLHRGCKRSALIVVLADKLAKPALATAAAVAVSYTPTLNAALRAMTKLFG